MKKSRAILVVDDHPMLRSGLKTVLSEELQATVHQAGRVSEAFDLLANRDIDLVILDLNLPDTSGLAALKELRKRYAGLPVLVYSMYPEKTYAVRVFRAGGDGYLNKQAPEDEVRRAVQTLLDGKRFVSDETAQELAGHFRTPENVHDTLTDREFEVFRLLAAGNSVSVAAKHLGLSVKTVSTHRANILNKMQLQSSYELIRYAVTHSLIESEDRHH